MQLLVQAEEVVMQAREEAVLKETKVVNQAVEARINLVRKIHQEVELEGEAVTVLEDPQVEAREEANQDQRETKRAIADLVLKETPIEKELTNK